MWSSHRRIELNPFARAAGIATLFIAEALAANLCAQSPTAADWPVFDVASIKVNNSGSGRHSLSLGLPGGRFTATNVSLRDLMTSAYQLAANRIVGAPAWGDSEYFDIRATAAGDSTEDQKRRMVQSLLVDRFKLVTHTENRKLPVYALVLVKPGKLGPQLHLNSVNCDSLPVGSPIPALGTPAGIACGDLSSSSTPRDVRYAGRKITIQRFLTGLTDSGANLIIDRPIVDRTGLSGTFDFDLHFASPQLGSASTSDLPSLFTALQEQLGLKLESRTGSVEVLVIDHVERPSEN